jgi:DNA polymerase
MPDQLNNELVEILGAARSQLEYLQDLGFDDLPKSLQVDPLPVCPVGQSKTEGGANCRAETLEDIQQDLGECQRCELSRTRHCLVYGVGNPDARLVLVGEAPGHEEDQRGEPFVGEAGRLLDRILQAMGTSRDDVYICNVLKCRPPDNRDPLPDEVATCEPFLKRQLAAIRPQVVITLGRFATQSLLHSTDPISRLRGNWQDYEGIPVMPTYHPAYLLRSPGGKRDVWEDMKQVLHRLHELDNA